MSKLNPGETFTLRNGKIVTVKGKKPKQKESSIETIEIDDTFVETEEADESFADALTEEEEMEKKLADAVAALAEAQVAAAERQEEFNKKILELTEKFNESRVSEKILSVPNVCSRTIVAFDAKYHRNFISSVKTAYDEMTTDDDKKAVLNYAKNRVKGNVIFNNATFETFEEFRKMVSHFFKPIKCLRTIEREVIELKQGKDEAVTAFAKRTSELNEEYAEAFAADRSARDRKTSAEDLEELERKVIDCFISGLKERLQPFIKGETDSFRSMQEALSAATKAESSLKNIDSARDASNKTGPKSDAKSSGGEQKQKQAQAIKKTKKSVENTEGKKEKICYNCREPGHFASDCSKPRKETETQSSEARSLHAFQDSDSESKNGQDGAGPSGFAHSLKASKLHLEQFPSKWGVAWEIKHF